MRTVTMLPIEDLGVVIRLIALLSTILSHEDLRCLFLP